MLFQEPQPTTGDFAQVVVERGVDRFPQGLTYAIPQGLEDVAPGERVIVPLGRGDSETAGWVISRLSPDDLASRSPGLEPAKIKPIVGRDTHSIRLPLSLIDLAMWIDGYYCTPIGVVLAAMLPGAVRKDVGRVTRALIDLGDEPADEFKPTRKQKDVLTALESLPDEKRPIEIRELAALAEVKTLGPIRKLIEKGVLSESIRSSIEAEWVQAAVDRFTPTSLTDEQSRVIADISRMLSAGFSVHLLHGVTGSGKTEVYIRLIEQVIAAGKAALVTVPEIALTPQTAGRLIGRLSEARVAVLHSGLTAAQRNQQWNRAASGEAQVIIGARSAIFAPIASERLGLIIVDEEHDASYKQDEAPRYHGRDVAIRRAQMSKCPVILGSATPSLESWHNATSGDNPNWRLHRLSKRIPGTTMPHVQIVDFREQMRQRRDRTRVHLIGPLLEAELRHTLDRGFQALLLLNRRGYANYIACPDQQCGWVMQCDHCDVTMVYHRHRDIPSGGFVRCHHCEAEQQLPVNCPMCSKRIVNFGLGTQRVEDELQEMFSELVEGRTLLRVDSDSMQSAKHFHDALGRFACGEVRVLLGTQMIAKGLDFPNVRLVGVINADTSINLPDFRASERTFQLVNQVAGRCGRGQEAGRVVVQSFQPDAMPLQLAAKHDYNAFAQAELRIRTECGLPPVTRMARIVIRHEDHIKAEELIASLATRLRAMLPESIRLRGPAPCPISRVAGRHRRQIELIAPDAASLQRALTDARNRGLIHAGATMAIDVDPTDLL